MKKEQVEQLIDKLAWNNAQSEIDSAMKSLITIDDDNIPMLILPQSNKALWENAALVLGKIGYPRIKRAIPKLLEWLKDVNWPGAKTVLELLGTVDSAVSMPHVEEALIEARDDNDDMWIGGIKMLLRQKKINKSDFTNEALYQILDSVDWC